MTRRRKGVPTEHPLRGEFSPPELTVEFATPLRPLAKVVDLGVVRSVLAGAPDANLDLAVKLATTSGKERVG
jgi:hypothetical protein